MKTEASRGVKIRYFIVATNQYINFASDLVNSMFNNLSQDDELNISIFTNEIEAIQNYIRPNINMEMIQIPNLVWPEATLKRYELIAKSIDLYSEEIYCYIDADMLACVDLNSAIRETVDLGKNLFYAVAHPGYWRGELRNSLPIYLRLPRRFISDIKQLITIGALGAWETRRISEAFVQRKKRRNYVAGGIWFAEKESFKRAVKKLSALVDSDLDKSGLVAKWHDESYLNRFITESNSIILNPSWCFAEKYPFLTALDPKVIAVSKGYNFVRQ